MSQQGERPTGHEDDWWRQLYDDDKGDTGPSVAADSLDDRFASAAGTVGKPSRTPSEPPGNWGAAPERPGPSGAPATGADLSSGTSGPTAGASGPLADRVPSQGPPGGADGAGHPGSPPDPDPDSDSDPDPASNRDRNPDPASDRDRDRNPDPPSDSTPDAPPAPTSDAPPAPTTDVLRRSGLTPQPAPWEPPAAHPPGPRAFPPGPTPPGFRAAVPQRRTPTESPTDQVPGARPPSDAPADHTPPPPRQSGPAQPLAPWARPATTSPSDAVPSAPSRSAEPPSELPPPADALPGPASAEPSDARPPTQRDLPTLKADEITLVTGSQEVRVDYVGSGPPTYDAEPTALPVADPDDLGDLVADTVLEGARYGACTLRAASLRGDSARYRGEPRRDSLLTARFGAGEQALVLVAMATGARATPAAHRAAAEACRWIGGAIGRSHARLAEDIRAARRGDLKSGLHRLTDRSLGRLRASAVEQGFDPEEYTASLRCLLLPADPQCRTRVFFGVGTGGLFRLRGGEWQDIEPRVADTAGAPVVGFGSLPHETPEGDRLTMDLGITTPPSPYEPAPAPPREPFRFRASVAREGDVLLLCTGGLAEPLRAEAPLAEHLAARWGSAEPPGLAAFLADAQVRVKGYADDRTAAAVWEA